MPISEDEYDHHSSSEATSSTMSKAELRKTHKPIMEKRRRARINHSLNEIKSLILEALKKDPARHSKLEKADILEMAVKHLQNIQRQQLAIAMASDPVVLQKFKAGFNECSDEVNGYLNSLEGLDEAMKQRINNHLQKCINGVEQIAQFSNLAGLNLPFLNATNFFPPVVRPTESGDQNNNPRIQIPQGLQLIPSRLPSGEFAFLVPNSNNIPLHFQNLNNNQPSKCSATPDLGQGQRQSAFVTVIPSSLSQAASDSLSKAARLLSPPLSPEYPSIAQNFQRDSSNHGFRPVNPSIQSSLRSAFLSTALSKPDVLSNATLSNTHHCQESLPEGMESRGIEICESIGRNAQETSNGNNFPFKMSAEELSRQKILKEQRTQILQESINCLTQDKRSMFQIKEDKYVNQDKNDEPEQLELKNMKFPIHNYAERERKHLGSPVKKLSEPLCIITNQSERYRQAHVIPETAHCEENIPHGVKRKFAEIHHPNHGLLTVTDSMEKTKFIKTSRDSYPSNSKSSDLSFNIPTSSSIIVKNPQKFTGLSSNEAISSIEDRREYYDKIFVKTIVDMSCKREEAKYEENRVSSFVESSPASSSRNVPEEVEQNSDMWRPW